MAPKNFYLKALRGVIHYAVLDPSNKFVEATIPHETVGINFRSDPLTVESSLHHIMRILLKNRHLPSPRSVEFQEISMPTSLEEICRNVRDKFPTIINFGMTNGCFKTITSFNHVVQALYRLPLDNLQHIDFSGNDFESFFNSQENSYQKFKNLLLFLFKHRSSLQTIIFTGKNEERIEWKKVPSNSETHPRDPDLQNYEIPTSTESFYRLFINSALASENTKMFSGESIYFFESIENYHDLQHIIIQDTLLDPTTTPLIIRGLKSTYFRKSLTLSRCFDGMGSRPLLSFFTELSKLPLQSLHIEHIFDRDTFHALAAILATSPFLRELSIDLPNRDNHRLIRTIIGGTIGAGAAGAALFFSEGTAIFGAPLIVGISGGSGATAGVIGGVSGSVADRTKASWDVPSRQVYDALFPFARSPNLVLINAGNYTRSDESHASMKRLLEKDTGNRIRFRFFSPV